MTRAAAQPGPPTRPARLAALHTQGNAWRLAVCEANGSIRVVETASLASGDAPSLSALLKKHRVPVLVRVIPSRSTICRSVRLAPGTSDEAAAALRLLAETQLPQSVPSHRRIAAVVPGAAPGGERIAMLIGWSPADRPPRITHGAVERWCPEIAALAALWPEQFQPAAAIDPDRGTIALLSPSGARVLIEDNSTPDAWAEAVHAALHDADLDPGAAPDRARLVACPDRLSQLNQRLAGVSADPAWLDHFAIAIGAAIAAASPDPLLRMATDAAAEAPRPDRRWGASAAAWLARRAPAVVAASVLAALVVPVGAAAARSAILSAKRERLKAAEVRLAEDQARAAIYRHLDRSRWPMTKLLADLATSTPVGVVAETVRLAPDQGMAVQGSADSADLVNTLQANLAATGIFTSPRVDRIEATGDGVSFSITSGVAFPHQAAKPIEDFASTPLAERLYGPGATNNAGDGRRSASRESRRPMREAPDGSADEPADTERAERPARSTLTEAPQPVTDEQIAAMSRGEAMKAWAQRKAFIKKPEVDADARARLEAEIEKLAARMKAAEVESSGGGP